MSINSLKKAVIRKIADTSDEEILRTVYRMLDRVQDIHHLSKEESLMIEEARAQYERGETVSDEELQKELDKWLKD